MNDASRKSNTLPFHFPHALPASGPIATEWALDTLFRDRKPDAWIATVADPDDQKQWKGGRYSAIGTALRTTAASSGHYFSCVLVEPGATRRLNKTTEAGACVFFDDVGEIGVNPNAKMDKDWLDMVGPEPTLVTETSENNFQYVYVFRTFVAPKAHQALVKALKANPRTHGGFKDGNDLVRYGRLPSGVNPKQGGGGFATRLVKASGKTYEIDELAWAFNLGAQFKQGQSQPLDMNGPDLDDDGHSRVLDVDPNMRVGLVRQAVKATVNNLDRDAWIHMMHEIEGALDGEPEAEEIFEDFTAGRVDGDHDAEKDKETWASRGKGRAGYGFLMKSLARQNTPAAEAAISAIRRAQARMIFTALTTEEIAAAGGDTVDALKQRVSRAKLRSIADFVAEYKPTRQIVHELLSAASLYAFTARTGVGKTGWLVLAALAIITGRADIMARKVSKGRVAFCTAENPDGVRMRLAVSAHHFGIDLVALGEAMVVLDVRVPPEEIYRLLESDARAHGLFDAVFVDTWQAFFDGRDADNRTDALAFTLRLRPLTQLPGGPVVVVATHPVKNASNDDLIPAGGGTILNEVDGNVTLARQTDQLIEFGWQGKLRGLDFDRPLYRLVHETAPGIVDIEGDLVKLPVLLPATQQEAEAKENAIINRDISVLRAIEQNPQASVRALAAKTNLSLGVTVRELAKMSKAKPPLTRR